MEVRAARRWGSLLRLFRIAGVLALLTIPSRAAAMPQAQTDLLALPNGGWRGIIATSGPIVAGGMNGVVIYNGWSQFSVLDGEVVEGGTWFLTGNSQWTGDVCSGFAVIKVDGVVTGTADLPVLASTEAVGTGTVTCGPRTQEGGIPAGTSMTAAITWDAVTCEHATGSFAIPANALVAAGGASASLVAPIDATRNEALVGARMESYQDELTVLMLEGIDFAAAVDATQTVNWADLDDLVRRSEDLNRNLRRINDCDRRIAGEFLNSLRNTMASLLDTLLENPDLFEMSDLARLTQLAIQTGLIGEGAPNQDLAAQYERAILEEVQRRLDEADVDCATALLGASIGHSLGDSATVDASLAAFDAICGGM